MKGKDICEITKAVRKRIALKYDLHYEPVKCNYKGECAGTCHLCDAELKDLEKQLEAKGISTLEIDTIFNEEFISNTEEHTPNAIKPLKGMLLPPESSLVTDEEKHHISDDVFNIEGDIIPFTPTEYTINHKLYKKCFIAGIEFQNIKDIWDELYLGAKLTLLREKNNLYDKNAVMITLANDYTNITDDYDINLIIGYLPRTQNKDIALLLDMGWGDMFECEISKLNDHGSYKERIEIAIYIKSKYDLDKSTKIRALSLGKNEFYKICRDLETKGNTYFHLRDVPKCEHNLPLKDDNVVFIYKQEEYSILYLMHLIAIGDEDYPFVKDIEEIKTIDDCDNYVFTNVKGPIKCHNSELIFLDIDNLDSDQPETYLSQDTTDLLKMIINEII